MNARDWKITASDIPALLLASVSAITVTAGARLMRGQNSLLMLMMGVGVAGATFVLDKLLVERLNSIRPRQSLAALLVCWTPIFLFATALATVATFSWIVPEITKQDIEEGRRAHWTREAEKISQYLVAVRAGLRKQIDTAQADVDSERRRAAAARREGTAHPPEPLRALQRKITAARELDKRLAAITTLPLDAPPDDATAQAEMARGFRDAGDVHASVMLVIPEPPPLPLYEPITPAATDVQSVLAEETQKRSWRAISAWGAALWVEVLPLLALWRGGRRIPLATRVLQWRMRARDTVDAILGRRPSTPLPFVIEPLKVRGIVRIALSPEYTLTDCSPMLESAIGTLTHVLGPYELAQVSNSRGDVLDEDVPLAPQLHGQPLVLSVVEAHP